MIYIYGYRCNDQVEIMRGHTNHTYFPFFKSKNLFYFLLNNGAQRNRLPYLKTMTTPYFAQIFCLFLEPKFEDFLSLLHMKFCPNLLPFLQPKLEDFLSLLHIKYCPIFLPFLKQNRRTWNSWLPHILPKFYAFFWSQKWRTFYHLLDMKYYPNVLPFWSQNWRTFYPLLHI